MSEIQAILWLLAIVFGLWQAGIGIAAIAILARGHRVVRFGIGPGILFFVFAIVAILL